MKINVLTAIIISSVVGALSCSNETVGPDEEVPSDVLIPLSDTYETLRKRTVYVDGKVDTTFNYESGVTKSIMFNGSKWYGYTEDAIVFFTNKPDGFHILHRPLEKQSLLYKYPAVAGESYDTFTFQGSSNDIDAFDENNITAFEMLIIDNNATVTQPTTGITYTGLLHVQKPTATVSTKGRIAPAEWYIKPGTGTVLFRSYSDNSLTTLQLEEEFLEIISN